jgi:hypothetical protein
VTKYKWKAEKTGDSVRISIIKRRMLRVAKGNL